MRNVGSSTSMRLSESPVVFDVEVLEWRDDGHFSAHNIHHHHLRQQQRRRMKNYPYDHLHDHHSSGDRPSPSNLQSTEHDVASTVRTRIHPAKEYSYIYDSNSAAAMMTHPRHNYLFRHDLNNSNNNVEPAATGPPPPSSLPSTSVNLGDDGTVRNIINPMMADSNSYVQSEYNHRSYDDLTIRKVDIMEAAAGRPPPSSLPSAESVNLDAVRKIIDLAGQNNYIRTRYNYRSSEDIIGNSDDIMDPAAGAVFVPTPRQQRQLRKPSSSISKYFNAKYLAEKLARALHLAPSAPKLINNVDRSGRPPRSYSYNAHLPDRKRDYYFAATRAAEEFEEACPCGYLDSSASRPRRPTHYIRSDGATLSAATSHNSVDDYCGQQHPPLSHRRDHDYHRDLLQLYGHGSADLDLPPSDMEQHRMQSARAGVDWIAMAAVSPENYSKNNGNAAAMASSSSDGNSERAYAKMKGYGEDGRNSRGDRARLTESMRKKQEELSEMVDAEEEGCGGAAKTKEEEEEHPSISELDAFWNLRNEISNILQGRSQLQQEAHRLQISLTLTNQRVEELEGQLADKENVIQNIYGELEKTRKQRDTMQKDVEYMGQEAIRLATQVGRLTKQVEKLDEDVMLKDGQLSILRGALQQSNE